MTTRPGDHPAPLARGDLYWVCLGPAVGSAPARRRPVVVVQGDHYNQSRLGTVIVSAVTSNTALASYPGNVFIPANATELSRDSVINVTALATVDRAALQGRIGTLPEYLQRDLDEGLRLVLDV